MTEKTDQANWEMSSWYEKRRDELLGLLKEATAVKIPDKYRTELEESSRKCQEDSFEIALVGEFQGGKSTTFNALCDGRDISPRGLGGGGIKTSAAVISAQNISNDEKKELPDGRKLDEWAEITFKSDAAIVLSAATILKPTILKDEKLFAEFKKTHKEIQTADEEAEFKHKLNVDEGLQALFDLGKKEHREILKKTVNILWNDWYKDKSHWNNWVHWNNGHEDDPAKYLQDDLDQLRIVTLQLRFYGTEEYKQLISQKLLPIDQFQKLIAFPKDWNIRWMNGADADFSINEVAFVFIHSVLVRLHSKNLQRLGCRITDCPGLFANSFDTQIAERAIRNADAIWYLINGDKMVGEKDLKIIGKISAMEMLGKIESTCNLRGSHEQKINEILPVTRNILLGAGYNLEVFPYNARLAFLAMQGDLLLNNPELFSELDYRNMKIDAKAKSDDPDKAELWGKMVSRLGILTEIEDLEQIEDLDDSTVRIVRDNSYFDNILTSLEDEIIPKKAKSILVDKGSERVTKALLFYEGKLKSEEDAAQAKVDEWKNEVDEGKRQLTDFIKKSEEIINKSEIGTESKRKQLAEQIAFDIIDLSIDDYFTFELSHDVSWILINIAKDFFISEEDLNYEIINQLSPKISINYREAFTRGFTKWLNGKDDEDLKSFYILQSILQRIHDNIRRIWEELRREWEEKKFNSIFDGIEIPEIVDSDLLENCNDIMSDIIENSVIIELAKQMRPGIGSAIKWPFVKILNWLRGNDDSVDVQELDELTNKIAPEIKKILENREFLNAQAKPIIQQLLVNPGVLNTLVHNLQLQLQGMKNTFEARVAENEDNFKKSSQERNKIAAENNKLRTKTIEPLRKRIEDFKDRVIKELGQFA